MSNISRHAGGVPLDMDSKSTTTHRKHAIPNLIPKWLRERVLLIMKDGDAQQRNEILRALFRVFPNAKEAGCGFHIGK